MTRTPRRASEAKNIHIYSVIGPSVVCYTGSMFSFFKKRGESELALVVDIGSGSVGAALVLFSGTRHPAILYTTRLPLPFQKDVHGARLHSGMLRTLSGVMLSISAEGFAKGGFSDKRPAIKEAVVALSAPWVSSKAHLLSLSQKEPQTITARVLGALLAHLPDAAQEHLPKALKIEEKLIKAALNGYPTGNPLGKPATTAEFSLFSSFAPLSLVRGIEETLLHHLHLRRVSFHSFSLMAFAVVRELFPKETDFLFLDISGEQTEFSIVKKQAIVQSATFPFGKNHLLRALHGEVKLPVSGAETFLTLHNEAKGEGKLHEKVERVLAAVQEEWGKHFIRALTDFSEEIFLPREVFLTVDADAAPVFADALKRCDLGKFTLAVKPPSVRVVGESELAPGVHWSDGAMRDSFLALEAFFGCMLHCEGRGADGLQ